MAGRSASARCSAAACWRRSAFGLAVGSPACSATWPSRSIKRDCQTKDASQSVPGFGGVLDVVDSVLFAAPVAYLWFAVADLIAGEAFGT